MVGIRLPPETGGHLESRPHAQHPRPHSASREPWQMTEPLAGVHLTTHVFSPVQRFQTPSRPVNSTRETEEGYTTQGILEKAQLLVSIWFSDGVAKSLRLRRHTTWVPHFKGVSPGLVRSRERSESHPSILCAV